MYVEYSFKKIYNITYNMVPEQDKNCLSGRRMTFHSF